jgi:hypothetical protein
LGRKPVGRTSWPSSRRRRSGVSAERRRHCASAKNAALCRDAASGRRFMGTLHDSRNGIWHDPRTGRSERPNSAASLAIAYWPSAIAHGRRALPWTRQPLVPPFPLSAFRLSAFAFSSPLVPCAAKFGCPLGYCLLAIGYRAWPPAAALDPPGPRPTLPAFRFPPFRFCLFPQPPPLHPVEWPDGLRTRGQTQMHNDPGYGLTPLPKVPVASCPAKRAINCPISSSCARRSWGEGPAFFLGPHRPVVHGSAG